MPIVSIYCQACKRDDDATEYWQCATCRLVMCREHWQEHTYKKNPVDENAGFWKTLGKAIQVSIVWDCPVCELVTTQHRIYPVAMYRQIAAH